ncbi:MAG TPA: hypothetical protein PKH07_20400, partial [bacterium]|nr:hypothetical protein [bacterium]
MQMASNEDATPSRWDSFILALLVLISGSAFFIFVTRPPEFWLAFPSLLRIFLEHDWLGKWPAASFWTTLLCSVVGYVCYAAVGSNLIRSLHLTRSRSVFL